MGEEDDPFITCPEGVLIRVRLRPSSSRQGIEGLSGGRVAVAVHSPPQKGRANDEAVKVLSRWLEVPRSRLEIVSGQSSRHKTVLVRGADGDRIRELLSPYR